MTSTHVLSSSSGKTMVINLKNPFIEHQFDEHAPEEKDGPLLSMKAGGILIVVLAMASDIVRPQLKDGLLSPIQREVYEVMVRSWKNLSADEFLRRFTADRDFTTWASIFIAQLFVKDEPEYWKDVDAGHETRQSLEVCRALKRSNATFMADQKRKKIKRFYMIFSANSFYLRGYIAKEVAPDCGDPE